MLRGTMISLRIWASSSRQDRVQRECRERVQREGVQREGVQRGVQREGV